MPAIRFIPILAINRPNQVKTWILGDLLFIDLFKACGTGGKFSEKMKEVIEDSCPFILEVM